MKGDNCLHVDFYYKFRNQKDEEVKEAELQDEYAGIIEILTSAKSYKKLAIGTDELHAKCFPPEFFTQLINAMIEK